MNEQGKLLDLDEIPATAPDKPAPTRPEGRVVRVLPDVNAISRPFDYVVPVAWEADGRADKIRVGTMVRVVLQGRRVGGWVVETDVEPPADVALQPLAKLTGFGPTEEQIDLARWVAWRWVGRLAPLLRSASPERVVSGIPDPRPTVVPQGPPSFADQAFDHAAAVARVPPSFDLTTLGLAAARRGNALIIAPSHELARHVAGTLKRAGVQPALMPRDWARAAGGAVVVGSRAAALAPVKDLAAVLVLDEHDEAHQEERSPTWNARDVAIERARRAGVPCVLTSPAPSLEALRWGTLITPSRREERDGWPMLDIVDRRNDDPVRSGLLSERLTNVLRGEGPVLCILNRKGRSRLLACDTCRELATCSTCDAAVQQPDDRFECPSCETTRPVVCLHCGATGFRNLRAGVQRVREEVEALANRPVIEVTGDADDVAPADVYVGTAALLHRVPWARAVVFLDFDQELLAPRYRAEEQAMGLLVRAARLVGPKRDGGRLVVQTRLPRHEVLVSVLQSDPGRFSDHTAAVRAELRQPPFQAEATVSGQAAEEFIGRLGRPDGVSVRGPVDGAWQVRAGNAAALADALGAVERPPGRIRIAVDPLRG